MNYYHFTNDISFEISLESVTTGQALDPSVISVVRLFTRKNGRVYCACYGNNTLINNGNTVTVILNNHGLEAGVLQYEVVMQIPDSIYPDKFKKISQFYVSDIELVKGQGQTDYADVQQMFGQTIDNKFQEINDTVDTLNADNQVVKATIVSIQEKDAAQDASINNIENIISGIHGDESAAISRLNSSVNKLETDVNNLNTSLGAVNTLVERMDSDLSDLSADLTNNYYTKTQSDNKFAAKTDLTNNYYTKTQSDNKFQVKGDYALKSDLDNINLTEYVKNSSLSANYPTNSSLSTNYAKKSEIQDFVSNSSVSTNYAKKSDLNNYPTNSSLSTNYVTKDYADQVYVNSIALETSQDEQNDYIAQTYLSQTDANENYVSYENIDEIVFNIVDNNYDVHWKINEIVNDSSSFADISTNVKDISTLVSNVSTKLDRDYLTAHTINSDFVKNTSLNTTLAGYVTKTQLNSSLLTKQDSLPFSDESDEIMDNDNLGIAGLAMNSVNGVDEYGILVTDGFEKDEQTGAYLGLENPITGNAAADLIQDYCEDFVQTTDISTFKPIVFCTQEEYDALVENDQVDANTVYMLNGDQTGDDYLTPDDVSNFVTTDDISTFITSNDVSIYLTKQEGQGLINQAYQDINLMMGTDLGQSTAQGGTVQNYLETYYTSKNDASVYLTSNDVSNYLTTNDASVYVQKNLGDLSYNTKHPIVKFEDTSNWGELYYYLHNGAYGTTFNGNAFGFDSTFFKGANSTPKYMHQRIMFNGRFGTSNAKAQHIGTITFMRRGDSSANITGNIYDGMDGQSSWTDGWCTLGVDESGIELMYNTKYGTHNSKRVALTDDISTFITSNDASVYATTSYVDTQIGNIQNILSTI